MHPHEAFTIRAFIAPARRARWLGALASKKRRGAFLDRLNHCRDLDERFSTPLASNDDVVAALRSLGAPAICYVMSDLATIDGQEMPLDEAVTQSELGGWGTIISCIPGQLAYYSDEAASRRRRMLLKRFESRPRNTAGPNSRERLG
ncbi:MAG: hypothetical protein NVSMB9_17980 [Isosphaeraceae bacterium]